MKKKYYLNYFNSINDGLFNSQFFIKNLKTLPEFFFDEIKTIFNKLRSNNHNIYFFGNGASAAFSNHMALDFSKNGKILSRSLSDSAMLTALSNDYSFEDSMLEFLKMEGVTVNDLVITVSSSGNSPNIVNVLSYCKKNKIKTLALSGLKADNKSIPLSDYSIYVPMKTYGMVECIHQIFLHLMLDESMEIFEWDRKDYQDMNVKKFNL